jgi:hypothetical protein
MKSFNYILLLILIALYLFFITNNKSNAKEPVYYYADSLIFNNNGLGPIRDYYDNVRLIQGNVNISCNYARYFMQESKSELKGNVILKQNDMMMKSPYAKYDGNTKISSAWGGVVINQRNTILKASEGDYHTDTQFAIFKNNVKVEDDTLTLYSKLLHYHKSVNDIEAYGDVYLFGKLENAILFADTLIRSKSKGLTKAINNAILYKIDTVKKDNQSAFDTTKISSRVIDVIESQIDNKDSQIYYFLDSVVINTKDIIAKCDTAIFDKTKGIIKLLNKPIVWSGENQLYGDSIIIKLIDNKLSKIESFGNALTVAIEDSTNKNLINQLSGRDIEFSFKNIINKKNESENTLDFINSIGIAKSLYFLSDTPGIADAKFNTCESIKVEFLDGKPDKVYWIDDISGTLYPYSFIKDNLKDYYLPNFRWSDEKPITKVMKPFNNK